MRMLQHSPDFGTAHVRVPEGHTLAAVCRGFTAPEAG